MATGTRCYKGHARADLHRYRRLCLKTHAIFEQQATCTSMHRMQALKQQGQQLFHTVALMHECPIGNGATSCAICVDSEAYGSSRPSREHPDPFPLLSRAADAPELTPSGKERLRAELHPYKRLCKLTHQTFREQERCTSLEEMAGLASAALEGLFGATEEPPPPMCMEQAAYGNLCPRSGI